MCARLRVQRAHSLIYCEELNCLPYMSDCRIARWLHRYTDMTSTITFHLLVSRRQNPHSARTAHTLDSLECFCFLIHMRCPLMYGLLRCGSVPILLFVICATRCRNISTYQSHYDFSSFIFMRYLYQNSVNATRARIVSFLLLSFVDSIYRIQTPPRSPTPPPPPIVQYL